jgi:intermediate peptidase
VAFDPDEVLQRDCQKYHCYAKHNNNAFLGVIILDMFARESKLCQGGHITVQLGCRPHAAVLEKAGLAKTRYAGADNGRQYPIVFLTCNAGSRRKVARRADGSCDEEATPMAPHEVTTAFHEFGHALHTIFGQTGVQNLAGTRGSIDFVECFSQLFEHFLTDHDFVKRWAVNRGVPIPKDVVLRTAEATSLFRSVDTLDQVVLSAIDQTLHGPQPFTARVRNGPPRILGGFDAYLNSGAAAGGLFGRRKQTPRYAVGRLLLDIATPFSVVKQSEAGLLQAMSADHLSSYPGGYYGYLYSGAFARRIWEKCFRDQPMNLKEGERLCDQVLQYGAACNAREVLQNYLGEPLDNAESWA